MSKKHEPGKKDAKAFQYFNIRNVPASPLDFVQDIVIEIENVLCPLNINWEVWESSDSLKENLISAWSYPHGDFHFRRVWLDKYVELHGYLVFNAAWDHYRKALADDPKRDLKADKEATNLMDAFLKAFA